MTIIEILVAGSLMLLLMISSQTAVEYIGQATQRMRNQIEPRQQVRSFTLNLRKDLQAAAYLYAGPYTLPGGASLTVPAAGATGDSLLFAVPQDDSANTAYQIVACYARPRSVPDDRNPGVRELVYQTLQPVTSTPNNTPGALGTIIPTLSAGSGSKVFDTYLPAGSTAGTDPPFSIRVASNGGGVRLMTHFRIQPPRGEVISERFDTFITLRNNN